MNISKNWFRWYHGTVSNPMLSIVASKANATVAEVVAVYAAVNEQMIKAGSSGDGGEFDFDEMDCVLGLVDGKAKAIYWAFLGQIEFGS